MDGGGAERWVGSWMLDCPGGLISVYGGFRWLSKGGLSVNKL